MYKDFFTCTGYNAFYYFFYLFCMDTSLWRWITIRTKVPLCLNVRIGVYIFHVCCHYTINNFFLRCEHTEDLVVDEWGLLYLYWLQCILHFFYMLCSDTSLWRWMTVRTKDPPWGQVKFNLFQPMISWAITREASGPVWYRP